MAGPLGKKVAVPDSFSPEILFPISRDNQRKDKDLIFEKGVDIWNLHEIFWLNQESVSNHNELSIQIPADSKFTVESKSLKLFVNYSKNICNIIYIYINPEEVFISYWKFLHRWDWFEGPKLNSPLELMKINPKGQSQRYQIENYKNYF